MIYNREIMFFKKTKICTQATFLQNVTELEINISNKKMKSNKSEFEIRKNFQDKLAWLFQLDSLNYWIMKGLKKT